MKNTKNLILVIIGLMAFITFALQSLISVMGEIGDSTELNTALLVNAATEESMSLDGELRQLSEDARVLALYIENDPVNNSHIYDDIIRKSLEDNNLAFGMGYWFEPYAYDPEMPYFGPYLYRDDDGSVLKTLDYSSEDYDYLSKDWYLNSFRTDKTTAYSQPFYDETLDTIFITVAIKIMRDDSQIGVVSVDMTMREINDFLDNLNAQYGIETYVITGEGAFWGSDDTIDSYERDILQAQDEAIRHVGEQVMASYKPGSYTNGDYIYSWSPVGDTDLRILMRYDKALVMNPLYRRLVINTGIFVVAMFFFILMVNWILEDKIEKPLLVVIEENQALDIGGHDIIATDKEEANFDRILEIIHQLFDEKSTYIHQMNATNSQLAEKNDEIEKLYIQSNVMNNKLKKLLDEVERGYIVTVTSLSNAIEAKDQYTKGHCESVTKLSLAMAEAFQLTQEEIRVTEYAAILHDVGKIGIPSTILNKPDRLTDEEFDIIKTHPAIGYEMLKDIDFLKRSALIVYQHHERIDGKGYPRGLTGDELDIITKIITVTDTYDAMTSARPYRLNPLSHEKAMAIIRENSGTQFDPEVVEVFETVIEELRNEA